MVARDIIRQTTINAVMLHLHLGLDSYMPDFLIDEEHTIFSPLAGQSFGIEDLEIMLIGPGGDAYRYHAALTFKANGLSVESYCLIHCSDLYGINSVQIECYVNGVELSVRTMLTRDGNLKPMGLASTYDLARAIEATTYLG